MKKLFIVPVLIALVLLSCNNKKNVIVNDIGEYKPTEIDSSELSFCINPILKSKKPFSISKNISDTLGIAMLCAFELSSVKKILDMHKINYNPILVNKSSFFSTLFLNNTDTLWQYFIIKNQKLNLCITKDHKNFYSIDSNGNLISNSNSINDTTAFFNLFKGTYRYTWTTISPEFLCFLNDTNVSNLMLCPSYIDKNISQYLSDTNEINFVNKNHNKFTFISIVTYNNATSKMRDLDLLCPTDCPH